MNYVGWFRLYFFFRYDFTRLILLERASQRSLSIQTKSRFSTSGQSLNRPAAFFHALACQVE
jgi:hypothetical protein